MACERFRETYMEDRESMKRYSITLSGMMFTLSGFMIYLLRGAVWMAVFCFVVAFLLEMANIGLRARK